MKHATIFVITLIAFAFPLAGETRAEESMAVGEFTFEYGEPWERQQVTSRMRAGQLTYDHEDENLEDVDLVLYHFGAGRGGSIQANIDRWIGQFQGTPESETEKVELGDREVTFLTATGTFMQSSGGPFAGEKTPKADYTMLAAILPSQQGDVYLKLTGPSDSVSAMEDAFRDFAESAFDE